MVVNSQGIVLNTLRYSDSSVIAKIYTQTSGLKSFMVRTGKGKLALPKMSLLQPLTIVSIAYDKDKTQGLATPRSFERGVILKTVPFDTIKTCIALFMAEVVIRSIGEEEANDKLFEFLQKAILRLDAETNSVSNFHLKFMLEFSGHLGFKPNDRHTGFRFFDLVEGEFTNSDVLHPHCVQDQTLTFFIQLLTAPFSEHHLPKANTTTRKQLLQHLVDFYRLHLEGMKEITSHKVLEEVMA